MRHTRAHVWAWWPLVRLLRRERVDVIHAHKFGSNIWGVVFGRLCGVPVVVTHEHGWSFEGRAKTIMDRELIARRYLRHDAPYALRLLATATRR